MPTDGEPFSISNSAIQLSGDKMQKFLKIRRQMEKELLDPDERQWYAKNKVPKTVKYVVDGGCPYAQKNGRVIEHYYVWWRNHPKDTVKYNEEIRHINGDTTDNRIENLERVHKHGRKKVKKE